MLSLTLSHSEAKTKKRWESSHLIPLVIPNKIINPTSVTHIKAYHANDKICQHIVEPKILLFPSKIIKNSLNLTSIRTLTNLKTTILKIRLNPKPINIFNLPKWPKIFWLKHQNRSKKWSLALIIRFKNLIQ